MWYLRWYFAFPVVAGILAFSGCASRPTVKMVRPGVQTPPPQGQPEQRDNLSRNVLNSVEAFLQRTNDYELPGVQKMTLGVKKLTRQPNPPSPFGSVSDPSLGSTSMTSGRHAPSSIPFSKRTSVMAQSQFTKRQTLALQPPKLTSYKPGSGPAIPAVIHPQSVRSIPSSRPRPLAQTLQFAQTPLPVQPRWTPQPQNSFSPYSTAVTTSFRTPTQSLPVVEALDIRPVTIQPVTLRPAIEITKPNQPPQTQTLPVTGAALVDQFLTYLRLAAEANTNFENEWRYRMANLALNRDTEASAVSPSLPEDVRTLLSLVVKAAQGVRRIARDPLRTDDDALERVNALRGALLDRSDLVVSTVVFCQKVTTFGAYEEMPQSAFVAGTPTQTIIYSEIDHFRSDKTSEGRYRTQLGTHLEILSPTGESLWQHEEPEIVDECRSRRLDFFIAQRITVPGTIPAGDYVFKVRVEDKLSGRISEGATTFTIHSALTQARRP